MNLAVVHSSQLLSATFTGATVDVAWKDWVELGVAATSGGFGGFSASPPSTTGQKFSFGIGESGAVVEVGPVFTFVQLPNFTVDDQWRTALLTGPQWFPVPEGARLWARWWPNATAGSSNVPVTVVLRPVSRR